MIKKFILILILTLSLGLLVGCKGTTETSFEGGSMSGTLEEDTPGSALDFTIEVEDKGDPIGIDFRGVLTKGSIALQMVDSEDQVFQEWEFDETGSFSINTTLYPPPGTYHYGMVWEEPVQLAQYSLSWKPHAIEEPTVTNLALLPGIGMITVALGFIIYAAIRRLGWGYLVLGALGWAITVALKFAWAVPINTPVYNALTGSLPETVAHLIFYLYVGALTGIFEVAIIWLVLRYTRLGQASWERAMAFGIGFGTVEALVLGVGSLISSATALTAPDMFPLGTLEQIALSNNLLYGLAPIWERFFAIIVHTFSNVLLFYGAQNREARWFWLAFLYKSGIDAVAAFAQFWGLDTLGHIWIIEGIVALWGLVGCLGIRALYKRYPLLARSVELDRLQPPEP